MKPLGRPLRRISRSLFAVTSRQHLFNWKTNNDLMIRLFFFFLQKLNIEIWNFTRCSHRASFQWTAITEFAYFVGGRTCGKGKGKELAPSTQTVRETFYTASRLWNGVHVTTIKRCGRHCFLTPIFNSPRSSCVYFVKNEKPDPSSSDKPINLTSKLTGLN